MRKKMLLLFICLIFTFAYTSRVYASNSCGSEADHSLVYNVESLKQTDDYLEMSGWAFIHNCHQCGNGECYGENDYNGNSGRYGSSAYKSAGGILAYYNNSEYFYKADGTIAKSKIVISYVNTKTGERYSSDCSGVSGVCHKAIDLSYNKVNLFSWMCHNSGSACQGYVVDNVGFTAKIHFPSDLTEGNYKFTISVKLKGENVEMNPEVNLGVSKNVYTGSNSIVSSNGTDIKIGNLTNVVRNINNECRGIEATISGNAFTFGGQCWQSGAKYYILDEFRYGDSRYTFSSKHYRPVTMYRLKYKDDKYWAPATWFTTIDDSDVGITILVEGNDKVCSKKPDKIINTSCSSKEYSYDCDGMKISAKVNDKTVSAIVKIKESGSFKTKDYTNSKNVPTITAGKGFSFNLHYDYFVEWSFSNYSCNGVNESICYSTLKTAFEKVYLNDVSADNLKSRLDNSGKAVTSSSSFDSGENINDAGEWSCSGSNKDSKRVISCKYEIKPAYYEYATNKISYTYNTMDRNKFKDLGSYFYIPLDYSKNSFKWNITTGTISLVKYRTVKGKSNTTSANWSVGTTNSCKINVRDGALTSIPPTGDDGKLVYRSVSTNVNMDNASLYYLTTNTNWYNYFYKGNAFQSGNASRIVNSYTHLHYKTVSLNSSRINSLLSKYNNNYLDWNYISNGGKSSMINNSDYFTSSGIYTNSNKHCSWGEFSSSCDKYS